MIDLFTGTPGDGKTLYAWASLLTDDKYKGRQVYVCNVLDPVLDDPRLEGRFHLLETFADWVNCPDGSVILADEIQDPHMLPKRRQSSDVPDYISLLAKHRMRGFDMIWITQAAMDVDQFARSKVDRTLHFRRLGGLPFTSIYEFKGFVNCLSHIPSSKALGIKRWFLDKKYFGLYTSAVQHTHKLRIPRPVYVIGFIALIVAGFWWWTYRNLHKNDAPVPSEAQKAQLKNIGAAIAPGAVLPARDEYTTMREFAARVTKYRQSLVPVDAAHPETASMYDDIRELKTFPKFAAAVVSESGCKAYTQQGTPLTIPEADCREFAAIGRFDPYAGGTAESGGALKTQASGKPAAAGLQLSQNAVPSQLSGAAVQDRANEGGTYFDTRQTASDMKAQFNRTKADSGPAEQKVR